MVIAFLEMWQKIFLQNLHSGLSFQGKQLTIFVANGKKNWAFKQNLEFWKTWILYYVLDRFPVFKDFSDEISVDINKEDFQNIV